MLEVHENENDCTESDDVGRSERNGIIIFGVLSEIREGKSIVKVKINI